MDASSGPSKYLTRHSSRRYASILAMLLVGGLAVFKINSHFVFNMNTAVSRVKHSVKASQLFIDSQWDRKTLIKLQSRSNFRQKYLKWDLADTTPFNDSPARFSENYFVFQCSHLDPEGGECGGWADQLKGAIFAYIVANLTGRTYKARFLKPICDYTNYIVPNRVNWTMTKSLDGLAPYDLAHTKFFNKIDGRDGNFKEHVNERNFDWHFKAKNVSLKHIVFKSNKEYITGLRNTTVYVNELSWMRDMTPADIYGSIYKRLFRLAPPLQERLLNILNEALPTPAHRLICIHVRLGHEASFGDWARRNSLGNLWKVWPFIVNQITSDLDKVFVMSDSEKVIASARQQVFADRLVTIDGQPIVHVDKFSWKNMSTTCTGLERLYIEHHMLMNCDVLVLGHSGLSVMAAAVRGSDKDLYCLLDDGTIVPCSRNDFSNFR